MKIEADKFYKTRDGIKVGPMEEFGSSGRFREEAGDGRWWDENGVGGNQATGEDLISEWHDLTPHQQSTADMIKVMQAYVDGEEIEIMYVGGRAWHKYTEADNWNWSDKSYRIAPAATPDTIDWSHVAPEFKWMARNINGTSYLHEIEPRLIPNSRWTSPNSARVTQASYLPGTCDWKDSLVKRPE